MVKEDANENSPHIRRENGEIEQCRATHLYARSHEKYMMSYGGAIGKAQKKGNTY